MKVEEWAAYWYKLNGSEDWGVWNEKTGEEENRPPTDKELLSCLTHVEQCETHAIWYSGYHACPLCHLGIGSDSELLPHWIISLPPENKKKKVKHGHKAR